MSEVLNMKGAFIESLKRNNKQIRDDRAITIAEEAELKYRRKIEDLKIKINNMKREQKNMMDLSPESAMSLVLASDFDADGFINKDVELSTRIRNEEITLSLAQKRYDYLFTGTSQAETEITNGEN